VFQKLDGEKNRKGVLAAAVPGWGGAPRSDAGAGGPGGVALVVVVVAAAVVAAEEGAPPAS
jgi:hypothetical protein